MTSIREGLMQEVDQRDRELLSALQGEIPVTSTPFAIVGQQIEMSEKEVLKRAEKLKRAGILRRISIVFNTRALGYQTCLVAARVREELVDRAASAINLHPGVFQNYRRNHDYSLWFTLALPPDSALGIERTVELLAADAECEATRLFPTLQLFVPEGESEDDAAPSPLVGEEVEFVKVLQGELPLQTRPFDALARRTGLPEDRFFDAVMRFRDRGQIRRIVATVQQRKTPFQTNAMSVWAVPPDRVEEFARRLVANPAVLRCYVRPTYPDWPYNLFATIHTRSVDECDAIVHEVSEASGLVETRTLFPTREYKNTRVTLFSGENADWEAARLGERHADSAAS
ncbi:MAG: Lrp/AsnC family transcriptional regulator [Acidobacteria bacterium]|nr:Lrp/AsnC family transcriptional regulator [Acidobacteriota bacterium]